MTRRAQADQLDLQQVSLVIQNPVSTSGQSHPILD